jgi:hypothetical protein
MLFVLIQILEFITAAVATVFFRKYAGSFLKYFLIMLWVVVIMETIIWVLKRNGIILQNNFLYNVFTSLQYAFYFLLYYNTLRTATYKKWILGFLISFVFAVVINFVWIQPLTITAAFHSITFSLGAILLIITIGLFLIEILNTEKVLYFTKYLMFWISMGLLIFYAGIIPFIISLNLLPAMMSGDNLTIVFFALNSLMYSCFTIGFIISHDYAG